MINWNQVKQLEKDVGAEDLAEVVTLFLSEVDEAVEGLDEVSKGTSKEIADALHFLKWSASNLGFQSFGNYCSAGETQAHVGDTSQISVSQVESLYAASKAQFRAELQQNCAIEF